MRIKAFLITLFAISSVLVNAQNKIQGYVLDKQTNEPLSYAIVSDLNQKYGSYSDTTGLFTLYYLSENDSLKVTNLGYKSIYIRIRDLQNSAKIFLEARPVRLGEVVVNPDRKKLKEMEIGFFTKRTNLAMATVYPLNLHAIFIPFPKDGGIVFIKSIKLIYEVSVSNSPMRVRLLETKPGGEPGDDLINENLIIKKHKNGKKQIADIDVSGRSIYMPGDGVFIVLEWIMDKTLQKTNMKEGIPGPYIGAIRSANAPPQWINSYNSSKWIKVPVQSIPSVGLTVVDYSK